MDRIDPLSCVLARRHKPDFYGRVKEEQPEQLAPAIPGPTENPYLDHF
jgi:hypothetical protein